MSTVSLDPLGSIEGYIACALVDSDNGVPLVKHAADMGMDLDFAASGNAEILKIKRRTITGLGLSDDVEDLLITLHKHYHLLRPLESNTRLFLYLVLDRAKSNLAMARHELKRFDQSIDYS